MKTRNRMIAVLGILLLCAGLFVACNSEVSEGAATGAGKTAYMSFDNGSSKAIEATSISQQYDIVPIGNVYWLYTATKKDNAGTTGQKTAMTPVKSNFGAGLNGVIGPMSVGKWEFKLEGYKNANSGAPSSGTYKEITIGETKKYYYESEKIYDGSSAIITLSENTASNPQVVSVDVKFAGTGNGTIEIKKGEFYWTDDNGGNVAADSNMLRIHLTLSQESVDKYDKYFNLVAENYSVGTATKTRYKLASETNTFEAAAGDYDATFAIERWTVVNNAPGERVGYVSGASGVTVKVYSQQTLKIDAQFLESVFGYVTFDGITPSPVLVQRLVLKTDTTSKTVSETQTITHDGLSVTYPNGTKLSSDTKEADDKKTADATTGFVYTSPTPSSSSVEVGDGNAVVYYTLTLNVAQENKTVLTVTKDIGAGRDVQRVYHNGSEMTEANGTEPVAETYSYNSSTGILTLYVNHASPIDVVYKPAVSTDVATVTHGTTVTSFESFDAAYAAATNGDTITLLKDVSVSNSYSVTDTNAFTIDLNGHNINYTGSTKPFFVVDNGTLNLTGSGIVSSTTLSYPICYRLIQVKGSSTDTANYSVLNVGPGVEFELNDTYAVTVPSNGSSAAFGAVVNFQGSIKNGFGITVSGLITETSGNVPKVTLDGARLTDAILYAAGYAEYTVNNATMTTSSGCPIEIRAGKLEVKGNTVITATATPTNTLSNGSGTTTEGAGIAVVQHNTKLPIVVDIKDGTISGHTALYQNNTQNNSDEDLAKIQINVSDGTFEAINGGTNSVMLNNYSKLKGGSGITGGVFSSDPSAYVLAGYFAFNNTPSQGKWTVMDLSNVFDGNGTEGSPYIINGTDAWMKLVRLTVNDSSYQATSGKYFKLTDAVNVSSITEETTVVSYFGGHIDFNNQTFGGFNANNIIYNLRDSDGNVAIFRNVSGDVSFSNLEFNLIKVNGEVTFNHDAIVQLVGWVNGPGTKVSYEGINIKGNIIGVSGNNKAPLMYGYGQDNSGCTIQVKSCNNYATIIGSNFTSSFIGSILYFAGDTTVIFDKCNNYGTIISTTSKASMLVGNSNSNGKNIYITIKDCVNYGTVSGVGNCNLVACASQSSTSWHFMNESGGTSYMTKTGEQMCGAISIDSINGLSGNAAGSVNYSALNINDNNCFVLEKMDNAYYYQLQFSFSAGGHHAGGGVAYTLQFGSADNPYNEESLPSIKVKTWANKKDATGSIEQVYSEYGLLYSDGVHYVFNEDDTNIRDNVIATFCAYGSSNELIGIKTYLYE